MYTDYSISVVCFHLLLTAIGLFDFLVLKHSFNILDISSLSDRRWTSIFSVFFILSCIWKALSYLSAWGASCSISYVADKLENFFLFLIYIGCIDFAFIQFSLMQNYCLTAFCLFAQHFKYFFYYLMVSIIYEEKSPLNHMSVFLHMLSLFILLL